MYFNYHAKVKRLINDGKLIKMEMVASYNKISPAMLLYFDSGQVLPIREHKFDEYLLIIEQNNKQ